MRPDLSNRSVFPNSARTAWLLSSKKQARPARITAEDRERKLLAKELARDLREASVDQLQAVAQVLGKSPKWMEMVKLEAHTPGVVGRAVLRAVR